MQLASRLSSIWFRSLHRRSLIYNTCWEDPKLDRVAMNLSVTDTVLVITSAGCNALDYLLDEPSHVFAVDINPWQNALLELKVAAIRTLPFDSFFQLFGHGWHPAFPDLYRRQLRSRLRPLSQRFWDRRISYFPTSPTDRSFYFRGTAGKFAHAMNVYIDHIARMRHDINALLEAPSLDAQKEIYYSRLKPRLTSAFLRWMLSRDVTLSLLGVPRSQRKQIERTYGGRIDLFIFDCVDAVFGELSMRDNYFWRVYLTGHYTRDCCPNYLTSEGFERLKAGLLDRLSIHTATVTDFLRACPRPISRFVLLDHMDWLSENATSELQREWQAIVESSAPKSRILFRSGGTHVHYVDSLEVVIEGQTVRIGEILSYQRELAEQLHRRDRVHTYGSFHIVDIALPSARQRPAVEPIPASLTAGASRS